MGNPLVDHINCMVDAKRFVAATTCKHIGCMVMGARECQIQHAGCGVGILYHPLRHHRGSTTVQVNETFLDGPLKQECPSGPRRIAPGLLGARQVLEEEVNCVVMAIRLR